MPGPALGVLLQSAGDAGAVVAGALDGSVVSLAPLQLAGAIAPFVESFVAGVLTPLTAACALPLYPAFVSYLARTDERPDPGAASGQTGTATAAADDDTDHASETGAGTGTNETSSAASPLALGVAVVAGVVAFMGAVGLVFAYALQISLTTVVEVVSPVAMAILLVLGVALLLDLDAVDRLPGLDPPETGNPYTSAFVYGAFFGGIILPCNPGFLALFFARSPIIFDTAVEGFVGFLVFGLGMGTPLLVFAGLSEARSRTITRALAKHSSIVNRVTGAIMTPIAAYYLLVVFDVLGIAQYVPIAL